MLFFWKISSILLALSIHSLKLRIKFIILGITNKISYFPEVGDAIRCFNLTFFLVRGFLSFNLIDISSLLMMNEETVYDITTLLLRSLSQVCKNSEYECEQTLNNKAVELCDC